MWALIVLAIMALAMAFAGMKGWVPRGLAPVALLIFCGLVVGALWLGLRGHRRALADRERASGAAMTIIIATQLARQDAATLEQLARKAGPAGDAARMILSGRRKTRA
jgi:hypothetical protein